MNTIFEDQKNPFYDTAASFPLCLLSGESTAAYAPYSFDIILPFDCILLIYTKSGSGKLSFRSDCFGLETGTLVLFPCHKRFQINILTEPWEHTIFFITGEALPFFNGLLQEPHITGSPRIDLHPHSEIVHNIEKISNCLLHNSARVQLHISALLYSIMTECILAFDNDERKNRPVPRYIKEMKDLLEEAFAQEFSLDQLEQRFSVSKYRLCREFKEHLGVSPIQYLNKVRIDTAMHYLETTDIKIHEIGTMIGMENTNHFILLFKRYNGVTPLCYRQNIRREIYQ